MNPLSDHTRLVNALILISKRNRNVQTYLGVVGYQLESIGLKFLVKDGSQVRPNVALKSDAKNSLLLVECKTGNIEHLQATRFKSIDSQDVISQNITGLKGASLAVEKCFACNESNLSKLVEADKRNYYDLPILVLRSNAVEKAQNSISFQDRELEEFFGNGVKFKQLVTYYFPYSASDPDSHIVLNILSTIAAMAFKNSTFSLDELCLKSHPLWEESLSDDEKREIKGKVGRLLTELEHKLRTDTRFTLAKSGQNTWTIEFSGNPSRLRDHFKELANQFEPSKNIPIETWFPKPD